VTELELELMNAQDRYEPSPLPPFPPPPPFQSRPSLVTLADARRDRASRRARRLEYAVAGLTGMVLTLWWQRMADRRG
jgi:hypothetical protein